LTQGAAVEPYLSKPLLNPISKYELKAGSVDGDGDEAVPVAHLMERWRKHK
jgi:hypothetical protein